MRKISKLSLVAAVAVAGFSTANAQPLEEAIKNVDVSGSVVYRYNDAKAKDKANGVTTNEETNANNNYKIALNLASKVNDYVKFNSRFIVGGVDSGFASLDTSSNGDTNVDVTLSNAYFGLTAIPNTTVNVGKQGLTTPWTVAVDSDGNEQTGTGVLALSTVGPVTAAAGYFNQTNLGKSGNHPAKDATDAGAAVDYITGGGVVTKTGSRDIIVGGLIADLSPVTLDAWYLDMDEMFDTYSLSAKSDFKFDGGKIGLEARYVQLELDDAVAQLLTRDDKNSMYRLSVDGKLSIFNAKVAYTGTDKKGGLTALDNDAQNTTLGWNLTSNDAFDADYWQAVLGVDVLDNLNISANYGQIKHKEGNFVGADTNKDREYYAQLTYKMSKNLNTYVRYGKLEEKVNGDKQVDDTVGRLQVEYTF
ncbi:major outer membrane protein [Aliarcobacter butzleri]|uniref:major outer membrane protein n=1 Tax=Aliarcobacter butzleri TaxID=28197 RepID=UPI00125F9EDA|nr:major outer membrane protein [Aliarcobacter butzleri]